MELWKLRLVQLLILGLQVIPLLVLGVLASGFGELLTMYRSMITPWKREKYWVPWKAVEDIRLLWPQLPRMVFTIRIRG